MASRPEIRFEELDRWIAENEPSQRAFGRGARIDKMTLQRLLKGKMKRFDADMVQRIAHYTAGKKGRPVDHAAFAAFLARLTLPPRTSGRRPKAA